MCAGHNTRSGVKLSNGPVRRTPNSRIDPISALAPPTDGRPTIGQLKHYTTISPTTAQPLSNPAPTIGNLNPSPTDLQPPRNREPITTTPQSFPNHIPAARSRQTDDSALGKHPRLNRPSCRIHNPRDSESQRLNRRQLFHRRFSSQARSSLVQLFPTKANHLPSRQRALSPSQK